MTADPQYYHDIRTEIERLLALDAPQQAEAVETVPAYYGSRDPVAVWRHMQARNTDPRLDEFYAAGLARYQRLVERGQR